MNIQELNWIAEGRLQEYFHSLGVKINYDEETKLESHEGRLWRPSSRGDCRSAILSLSSGLYPTEEILNLNFGALTETEIIEIIREGRETPEVRIIFGHK